MSETLYLSEIWLCEQSRTAFCFARKKSNQEEQLISYQVLRIEKFSKGDLGKIGAETERTARHHRNEDIDSERTPLNYYFKKSEGGLNAQWKQTMQDLNATFKETKKAVAFEGVIVTSDKTFFEAHGYVPGEPLPLELQRFFADSYAFLKRQIGYHGTDQNILSAAVHLDETTPHLQLYYIPVVDEGRKKVYAKGADGKVLRNAKGSPVQAKDKSGKSLYERVLLEQPKICSSEFWEQRGAQSSFGNLQDEFHEQVTRYYGLERGEVGSNKKHTTKYQWKKQQQEKELAEKNAALTQATAQIEAADRTLQDKNADISAAEEKLEQTQFRADLAEGRQAHAEREAQRLERERERLTREVAPLSAAAEAFKQASGTKPDKRQIPALVAENARLEKELEYSIKDQHGLYTELQASEKENAALKRDADTLRTLKTHAPDKLQEAMDAAKRRRESKRPPFRDNSSSWTK